VLVVGQDAHWQRGVMITTAAGRRVDSHEEPECTDHAAFARAITQALAREPLLVSTGAGGDNGTGKIQKRREISVGSYYDQSHYLHPHV
jgi:hypothetical protein